MTDFTRVTVVGTARRADVVVASDEAYAGLLPRFLEILGEPIVDSARPMTLVRTTGEELDLAGASADQEVVDGEVLHLVRRADAPPPPEVSDVTDAVAEALGARADVWGEGARKTVAAVVVGATASLGGALTVASFRGDSGGALGLVLGAAVVLLLGAAVSGRAGARWPALVLTAGSTGLALPVGIAVEPMTDVAAGVAMVASATMLWAWIALGVGVGFALRRREVVLAASVGGVLSAIAGAMWFTAAPTGAGWGVVAVLAVLACGLLPWYAMSVSGLTGLDDRVAGGQAVPRAAVRTSLDDAYRSLTWSTAAIAAPIGLATATLLAGRDPWGIALGAVAVLVTALRTRSLPLATQGVFLWSAVAVAVVVGAVAQLTTVPWIGVASLAAVAVVAAVLAGVRPAPHQRARLRSIGNAIEGVAVVVLLPVLLGAFGLYARLLGTF